MDGFLNALVSGITTGALYGIMALGLSIIYGVSRVFNFVHGMIAMTGAYVTWFLLTETGIGLLPASLIALIFMAFFGLLLYRLTMSPMLKKPNWEFTSVVFMLGFGILMENTIHQIFGPRVKSIPIFTEAFFRIGEIRFNWHELILIVIMVLSVILLNLFFKNSRIGQAMRAVAQSISGARVVGIDIEKIFGYTFALAFIVTGFSGILLGTKYYVSPHIGWEWMVKGFVIVSFGGLGVMTGAIYAGLILGIIESLATLYLGPVWVWPVWFVVFFVILLVRPQGLMGGRV